MLTARVVRDLDLAPGTHPRGKRWLSAASSLVCVGRHAYVIADDEHHLGHFRLGSNSLHHEPVQRYRLFAGALPRDKGKRKKAKPDLESLVLLPALDLYPHGALLALGSGSRAPRCRAALLALDGTGNVSGAALHFDLSRLYFLLQQQFGALNIEGAFIADGHLHLLQRGNKTSRASACLSFDLEAFLLWLFGSSTRVPEVLRIQRLDLGSVEGVPLAPTDAAALADGAWLFCAVAENTGDNYADGACVASAVGIIDRDGRVRQIQRLQGSPKVEGIAIEPGCNAHGAELSLLLVTDADDPSVTSQLLQATLYQDVACPGAGTGR